MRRKENADDFLHSISLKVSFQQLEQRVHFCETQCFELKKAGKKSQKMRVKLKLEILTEYGETIVSVDGLIVLGVSVIARVEAVV